MDQDGFIQIKTGEGGSNCTTLVKCLSEILYGFQTVLEIDRYCIVISIKVRSVR